ncbi:type II toxin-antitoxin system ParD family antitoxin [Methylobacterium brachiatum]
MRATDGRLVRSYGTASEVVRAALRLPETDEAKTVKRCVNMTKGKLHRD